MSLNGVTMRSLYLLAAGAAICAAPASAQRQPTPRPQALTRVLDCRTIQSAGERLACFDREVAALQAAEASRELVVVDRQQIRRTRRSLFGLTLPSLGLFGDDNDDPEVVNEITGTVRTVSQNAYRRYTFTLEDGQRWAQIDGTDLGIEPRAGDPIRIRRAAMGSYLANVRGQTAMRVRRVR